jgi:hypothetical protein
MEVTSRYLQSDMGTSALRHWENWASAPGDEVARLQAVRVLQHGAMAETVDIRYPVVIEMEYWNLVPGRCLIHAFSFFNDQGTLLFASAPFEEDRAEAQPQRAGLICARCTIPGNLFAEGQVRLVAEVSTRQPIYQIHVLEYDAVAFQVVDSGEPGSVRANWGRPIPGVIRPMLKWEYEFTRAVASPSGDGAPRNRN